jgi:uncharacterized membrane protein YqaE (UPF0057 family)
MLRHTIRDVIDCLIIAVVIVAFIGLFLDRGMAFLLILIACLLGAVSFVLGGKR